jgi:hypothetical protein
MNFSFQVVSTVEARAVAAAAAAAAADSGSSHNLVNGSEHNVRPMTSSPHRRSASPTSSGFVKVTLNGPIGPNHIVYN